MNLYLRPKAKTKRAMFASDIAGGRVPWADRAPNMFPHEDAPRRGWRLGENWDADKKVLVVVHGDEVFAIGRSRMLELLETFHETGKDALLADVGECWEMAKEGERRGLWEVVQQGELL